MMEQRNLDTRALVYLREYLKFWRMPGLLLSNLNLEQGKLWTYLAPEIADSAAYNFSNGGITPPSTVRIPLGNGFYATLSCPYRSNSAAY